MHQSVKIGAFFFDYIYNIFIIYYIIYIITQANASTGVMVIKIKK